MPISQAHGPVSLLWAEPDQAASLATLHARSFADPWDARSIYALLEAETAVAFYATIHQASDVVGFIIGRTLVDEAEIITLCVDHDVRRAGIGQRLLEGFEAAVRRSGAGRVVLEVACDNVAGRALYETAGYEAIARRTGYYVRPDGRAVDAIVLGRTL